eukprot:gene22454-biopygen7206
MLERAALTRAPDPVRDVLGVARAPPRRTAGDVRNICGASQETPLRQGVSWETPRRQGVSWETPWRQGVSWGDSLHQGSETVVEKRTNLRPHPPPPRGRAARRVEADARREARICAPGCAPGDPKTPDPRRRYSARRCATLYGVHGRRAYPAAADDSCDPPPADDAAREPGGRGALMWPFNVAALLLLQSPSTLHFLRSPPDGGVRCHHATGAVAASSDPRAGVQR